MFNGADENVQDRLSRCCAWRYDPETDQQRRQMLIDLACGDILDKYVLTTAVLLIDEQFDHIKPEIETYKEILSKLDRTKHEDIFQRMWHHLNYLNNITRVASYIILQLI